MTTVGREALPAKAAGAPRDGRLPLTGRQAGRRRRNGRRRRRQRDYNMATTISSRRRIMGGHAGRVPAGYLYR